MLILILYACVMGAFFWLQRIQDGSVMFITIDQEMRQHRLIWVVIALSVVIVIALLILLRYTRYRSEAEAALIAETGFRRASSVGKCPPIELWYNAGRESWVNDPSWVGRVPESRLEWK